MLIRLPGGIILLYRHQLLMSMDIVEYLYYLFLSALPILLAIGYHYLATKLDGPNYEFFQLLEELWIRDMWNRLLRNGNAVRRRRQPARGG